MRLFFGFILGTYATINIYLFTRLWLTLSGTGAVRGLSCAALALFTLAFPISRVFEGRLPHVLQEALMLMGSLYIAPMIYGFMLTLCADLLRIANHFVSITPMPPPFTTAGRVRVVSAVFVLSVAISLLGALNARIPTVVNKSVVSPLSGPEGAPVLRIALLSDIHFGRLIGNGHLERLVRLTNDRNPDLVLLAGDIIDDTEWMGDEKKSARTRELLASMKPRLGVWAVPGNHEYYAGIERCARFLESAGVRVLRDQWAVLGPEGWGGPEKTSGDYLLIGRDDRTITRFGMERKSLAGIIGEARAANPEAAKLPVILMDHQPFDLDEASGAGVALQLSGHTHRGQLFPFNLVVSAMYECAYGLYRRDDTWFYTSSGAGTWGPPVRTTGRPEVVTISLAFEQDISNRR